ncbi:lipoate--protein ligase family protein [Paraconexibacter antarcticus]|uniref:Lipoate--protein ligase family protein n=1 Tax=Paraconexibacter antarcticus TaxID=2949664 RepID=A0ABY5DZV7_9ACTN|nr:biotin/lipoate A/B protein ligase family protein [Paraconexibacter antarcticus]UTI66883.1 lipoate--protein ligase family protein [Paraconexibacter antarcticus]
MTRWRLLIDDSADAATGLATDEALMLPYGRTARSEYAATLRLYSYRSHAALVGRFQSLDGEIDLAVAARHGIDVGRRPTGGGAIVMGEDQLGVAVATRAPAASTPRALLARYADGIIAGLATLGIAAESAGKNDLQVGGRKIAGLGLHVDERGALLFHASVLADLNVDLMLDVLKIPGAKLADKPAERVQQRITTVAEQLGRPVPVSEVRAAVAAGFRSALGVELQPDEPSADECDRRDSLVRDRYAKDAWTQQRTHLRDAHGTALLKTPEGLARIYVATHGATIKSAFVTGDFNTLPDELVALEAQLRWTPATPSAVTAAVHDTVDDDALGVSPNVLAAAVWEATERALGVAGGAHPVRPSGSCYFPDGDARPAIRSTTSTNEAELV